MNKFVLGCITVFLLMSVCQGQAAGPYILDGFINGPTVGASTVIKLVLSLDVGVPKPHGGDTVTVVPFYVPNKGLYYVDSVSDGWAGTITPISTSLVFKSTVQSSYGLSYINPTPGSRVSQAMHGLNFTASAMPKLPKPSASLPAGNAYPGAVDTLGDTLTATIHYSTNGGAYGTYTAPVHINTATSLKMYATLSGYISSDTVTLVYTWLPTAITRSCQINMRHVAAGKESYNLCGRKIVLMHGARVYQGGLTGIKVQ